MFLVACARIWNFLNLLLLFVVVAVGNFVYSLAYSCFVRTETVWLRDHINIGKNMRFVIIFSGAVNRSVAVFFFIAGRGIISCILSAYWRNLPYWHGQARPFKWEQRKHLTWWYYHHNCRNKRTTIWSPANQYWLKRTDPQRLTTKGHHRHWNRWFGRTFHYHWCIYVWQQFCCLLASRIPWNFPCQRWQADY